MPYTVPVSFDSFLEKISLHGDHSEVAATRAKRIVELLGGELEIIETVPMGSILQGTALHSRADMDVLVALHFSKHIKDKSPKAVLEAVRAQLSSYNAKMAKKNGQSVTLYFTTWPNVDIVPAARVSNNGQLLYYNIPDANTGEWIQTKPAAHATAMRSASINRKSRIRMIKAWNDAHSELLQSFHIEVLELNMSEPSGNWSWDVFQYFDGASKLISLPIVHPLDASNRVDGYLNAVDRAAAKARLETARDDARTAWWLALAEQNRHQESITLYRRIFGNEFPAYG